MLSKLFMAIIISALFSTVLAGPMEGHWMFHKDNADSLERAISISGQSFISLINTPEGVAYERGWWTETPRADEYTRVIVSFGDQNETQEMKYKMENPDLAAIWFADSNERWGTMNRMNCNLTMQYRLRDSIPPVGCAWMALKGWSYSYLDGDCMENDDDSVDADTNEMACLIEAPANFLD